MIESSRLIARRIDAIGATASQISTKTVDKE